MKPVGLAGLLAVMGVAAPLRAQTLGPYATCPTIDVALIGARFECYYTTDALEHRHGKATEAWTATVHDPNGNAYLQLLYSWDTSHVPDVIVFYPKCGETTLMEPVAADDGFVGRFYTIDRAADGQVISGYVPMRYKDQPLPITHPGCAGRTP